MRPKASVYEGAAGLAGRRPRSPPAPDVASPPAEPPPTRVANTESADPDAEARWRSDAAASGFWRPRRGPLPAGWDRPAWADDPAEAPLEPPAARMSMEEWVAYRADVAAYQAIVDAAKAADAARAATAAHAALADELAGPPVPDP